jgi:hypothetical protein
LSSSRWEGFNGWQPLDNTEILSWCILTGVRLRAWELAAIRALDRRLVRGPPPPDEPVTPAMFDKMFNNG